MNLSPQQAKKLVRKVKLKKQQVKKQSKNLLEGRRGRVKKIKADLESARKEITMTAEEISSAVVAALQPTADSAGVDFDVSYIPGAPAPVSIKVTHAAPTV